jgi:hypothetical protein
MIILIKMTLNKMTISITAFSMETLSVMILGSILLLSKMTLSTVTISITAFSI